MRDAVLGLARATGTSLTDVCAMPTRKFLAWWAALERQVKD